MHRLPARCKARGFQIRLSILILTILLLALTACQPALTPVPLPTPAVLAVQATPGLDSLNEHFQSCAAELANTSLVLLRTPARSLDPDQAALALRWGAPAGPGGYTAVIGQERLAVVVHPSNPVGTITLADLQAIYSGSLQEWPDQSPSVEIQPWMYPQGDDTQSVFDQGIMGGNPLPDQAAYIAPDPAAMREAISSNTGAIGYLPERWLDDTVKEVPVEDLKPGALRQPILAMSQAEPRGTARAWLLCLQDRLAG